MNNVRQKWIKAFLVLAAVAFLIPAAVQNASAELKNLSDNDLSSVYAEGFSNFTVTSPDGGLTTDTTAEFNILISTYTTIDSLKLGWYPSGGVDGWDEDWTDVVIGQDITRPEDDLIADGVYFKANFSNIDDPTTRQLNSITFGANSVTGDVSAEFNSFSGTINGVLQPDRTPLNGGSATVTLDNSPFSLTLSLTDGYSFNFGDAVNPVTVGPRLYNMPPP